MSKPKVTIIIINFNGLTDTVRCLQSVKNITYSNLEVIIIDNGSDNKEGEMLLKKYGKNIKVFILDKNTGFTGGNNLAYQKAKGKYIILLNNDTEVTPGFIEPLIELLENDKKIAVAQPKIKMLSKKNYFDYAGAAGGYIDKYGYPFTRGRIFETKEKDSGQYDKESVIFWASGAACVIRKSAIKRIGGLFDPVFFNYMEEIDFCWRVWRFGFKVYYCPNSTVYHKGAASAGKDLYRKRYWEHRNNLILLYMNLNSNSFNKIILARVVLEIATYFHYLVGGNFMYLKSLFHAHISFIEMVIKRKIKMSPLIKAKVNKIPYFPSSIVYYYYILKRYTFNQLKWSALGNISFIIFNTKASGGLKLIFTQANNLITKGYSVSIYSLFGKNTNWFSPKMDIKNIINYYLNMVPDVLIFTFWPVSYLYKFLKSRDKYFLVMDSELFYRNNLIKFLVRRSFKLQLNKITISSFLKKELLKTRPKTRIKLINTNIVNFKQYIFKRNPNPLKNRTIRVLSVVSNYGYYKGIDNLAETVKKLKNINKIYHFTLISREKHKYDPIFDRFFSNLSDKMVMQYYRESDVLLSTSRSEGFFLPGLEAMAAGCLLVSTNSFGILDYAKNNSNCILVDKYSDIWEKDIIYSTFKNTKLYNKLISNGYRTLQEYSNKHPIEYLDKILLKYI